MCTTDRHDGSCPTCETDEWVVPADLRRPAPASMSGPLAPDQPGDAHGPALTRDGFTERLRALGRDGGERPAVERVDKYTVRVDGVAVVAGPETESRLRQMDAEQRRMFAHIMRVKP